MAKISRKDPALYTSIMDQLEQLAYRIPKDEAERIVRAMRPKGQYWTTAKLYGLHADVDVFYNLAKDFIEDPDAKPMKVEKYFLE